MADSATTEFDKKEWKSKIIDIQHDSQESAFYYFDFAKKIGYFQMDSSYLFIP